MLSLLSARRSRSPLDHIGLYCTLQYIRSITDCIEGSHGLRQAPRTLTFRIEPSLKEALRTAAEREHRSIANMVEVMIRDYCGRHGITIRRAALDEDRKPQRPER